MIGNQVGLQKKKDYKKNMIQDIKTIEFVNKIVKSGKISNMSDFEILNQNNNFQVKFYTDKVSSFIGKKGSNVAYISNKISNIIGKKVSVDVREIKTNLYSDVSLLSEAIAARLSKGRGFKDIVKNCQEMVRSSEVKSGKMKINVIGVKVLVSGRINGAEIARSEKISFGRIPLSSIAAKIDYKCSHVWTKYGILGLKIWIAKKEMNYN